MARQVKSDTKLAEAADKAAALLQGLQSRLNGDAVAAESKKSVDDLDRQLEEYFQSSDISPSRGRSTMDEIRERIIDVVADRILTIWERGDGREMGTLENQVIDRVAERILERMTRRA